MKNLIKNELIKIFKRKNIYFLLILILIVIVLYNYINPEQNAKSIGNGTQNININFDNNDYNSTERKNYIDYVQLYNRYIENSWQRFALNEEKNILNFNNIELKYDKDIEYLINYINTYELKNDNKISYKDYLTATNEYNNYIIALDSNNWKNFIQLKISHLIQEKNKDCYTNTDIDIIDIMIDSYKMRLDNDIPYGDDIFNQYIEEYMINKLNLNYYNNISNKTSIQNKFISEYKSRIALIEYALKNKIVQDISPENFTLIKNNKIDARILFIRTLKNFDILVIMVAIYISSTILTEEINTGTIKRLLTNPHTRIHIILSKIFASIITIIITITFIITAQYITGGIIFGFDSYNINYIGYDYTNSNVFNISLLHYILLVICLKIPMYIFIVITCIFIGTINNHISMSVIISFATYTLSSIFLSNISTIPQISLITRYFIMNNWDFSKYLFGQISDINGVNITFSIIIYILHTLIIIIMLFNLFKHKDIKNI